MDIHVAPLGHISLIPDQPVFAHAPKYCVFCREATHTNVILFGFLLVSQKGVIRSHKSKDMQYRGHMISLSTVLPGTKTRCYLDQIKSVLYFSVLLLGIGLWFLAPLSIIFQLYRTRRKPPSCMPQITDKLYHLMLYGVHLA